MLFLELYSNQFQIRTPSLLTVTSRIASDKPIRVIWQSIIQLFIYYSSLDQVMNMHAIFDWTKQNAE